MSYILRIDYDKMNNKYWKKVEFIAVLFIIFRDNFFFLSNKISAAPFGINFQDHLQPLCIWYHRIIRTTINERMTDSYHELFSELPLVELALRFQGMFQCLEKQSPSWHVIVLEDAKDFFSVDDCLGIHDFKEIGCTTYVVFREHFSNK